MNNMKERCTYIKTPGKIIFLGSGTIFSESMKHVEFLQEITPNFANKQ